MAEHAIQKWNRGSEENAGEEGMLEMTTKLRSKKILLEEIVAKVTCSNGDGG